MAGSRNSRVETDMSILKRVSMAILVIALIHPGLASAQTEERIIYASVVDQAGAPVTALTASDFIVREEGVPREILRVAPAADALRIAVLIDTSQAMEPYVSDLRRALRGFINRMAGEHELALVAFGERPTVLVDYTRDPGRLEAGIDRVFAQSGSGAYLLDAIVEVSRGLLEREGTRSAIVVITAEGPEFSERYHRAVLDELRRTDATLQAFVLTRPGASFLNSAARERDITLAEGASVTGGQREDLLTSMSLGTKLQELAARLENQYRVVYARPGGLIPPEAVEVSVSRPGVTVRAPRVPQRSRTRS
jgi:Ca-activated chloride channel family protein